MRGYRRRRQLPIDPIGGDHLFESLRGERDGRRLGMDWLWRKRGLEEVVELCAALERVREIYFGYGPPPRPKESFFLYELKPDP